jgi:hypothetical protein
VIWIPAANLTVAFTDSPAPRLARMPDQIGPGPVAELDLQGPLYGTAAQCDFGYEPEWTLARGLTDLRHMAQDS